MQEDDRSASGRPTEPMSAAGAADGAKTVATDSVAPTELADQTPAGRPPSSDETELAPGTVIRERFRITGRLGSGGMGVVYRATDLIKEEARDFQTEIGLKVLKPGIADAELTFMALQREARRAQQLAHPNIVTVYDFDRAGEVVFMTMELLEGQPLDALLDYHSEGLEAERARQVAADLARGLGYAHRQGIVHADLKPENVFVLDDGRAKILDFGIACAWQAHRVDLVEKALRGFTPAYASPQVLAGKSPQPTDDVYALGCVVYQMFSGHHPFDHVDGAEARRRKLRPARPAACRRAEWRVLSAALDFDAARRPADAGQFLKRFSPSPVRYTAYAVAIAAVVAAAAWVWFYDPPQGPDVPLAELPAELRVRVSENLADAGAFANQGDFNTALQLYDMVLRDHAGNREAVEGMNGAAATAIDRIMAAHRARQLDTASARAALEAVLEYESLPAAARRSARRALDEL